MVDLHFLVFIHLKTRRIWVSPCTATPNAEWTTQQARNLQMHFHEEDQSYAVLQREQDRKYTFAFDELFRWTDCTIKWTPPRSPNLQTCVERVFQPLKHEGLNTFCVIHEKHLDYVLKIGADWYNKRRCHAAREHLPPMRDKDQLLAVDLTKQKLVCVEELGGHLKSYRAAA